MTACVTNCQVMSIAYENSGIRAQNNRPTCLVLVIPKITPRPRLSGPVNRCPQRANTEGSIS